jgi:hypothetical protein
MTRAVKALEVYVDGILETEVYMAVQRKDSVRVFGDGVMPSGIWNFPFYRVRQIAEHKALARYAQEHQEGRLTMKCTSYSPTRNR